MAAFTVKRLDEATWPDFARLVERHNGVWGGCWCMAFHAEGGGAARPSRRSDPRRNAGSVKAGPMLPSSTTARPAWAGVSLGRQKSFHASNTSVPIAKGLLPYRIGGSPVFLSTSPIAAKGSRPLLSKVPCRKSPTSAEARSKAIPKMQRAGRSHRPSCTMQQRQCLSGRVSSAPVSLEKTAGLSPKSWCRTNFFCRYMGIAEANQAQAFRMFDIVPLKTDGAKLIWLSTRWAQLEMATNPLSEWA
jgi:hypothetical protein